MELAICMHFPESVQGSPARPRLSFVHKKLGIPPLLTSCYDQSARFPPAQAGLGKLSNIPVNNKRILGLRCPGYPVLQNCPLSLLPRTIIAVTLRKMKCSSGSGGGGAAGNGHHAFRESFCRWSEQPRKERQRAAARRPSV